MPLLNWQESHCLFLWHGRLPRPAALRVAADPVPYAEILNYIKKIDPSLDLEGGGADQQGQRQ